MNHDTLLMPNSFFDPDKNIVGYLFFASFAFAICYTMWPYILGAIVLYAIVKGFCSQRHSNKGNQGNHDHGNRRKNYPKCKRSTRW